MTQSIKHYPKVLILGSPGSGKTTLAKELAHLSGFPLFHLDDLYWKQSWQRPSSEQWFTTLAGLVEKQTWIIDGNHMNTLSARLSYADLIILIDSHWWQCVYRVVLRVLKIRLGNAQYLPRRIALQHLTGEKVKASNNIFGLIKKIVKFHRQDYSKLYDQVIDVKAKKIILTTPQLKLNGLFKNTKKTSLEVSHMTISELKESRLFDSAPNEKMVKK